MRCPHCGAEMGKGETHCKNCDPDGNGNDKNKKKMIDSAGIVYTMDEWLKSKEVERALQFELESEDLKKKIDARKRQMEEHQAEMNIDQLIEDIKGSSRSGQGSSKLNDEAEIADNLSKLSEEDFNKLVRELARDKKKEAREKLKNK